MARRKQGGGLTSVTLPVSVKDTSSTTGGGLSGLTSATSGLVCEYRRQGQSAWTTVTLSAGTLGTWSSGGFVADGSQAGDYELGLPDAALASGARWVIVRLRGATNMYPVRVEVEIDAVNYQDSVRLGLTALPNVSAGANGGLPLGDASARVDVGRILGTASAGAAGYVAHDMAQTLPASPTANTTGAALFAGAQSIGRTGTAQAGGANTITLDSGASATDNAYASHEIKITSGTGSGQFATITGYVGSTKVATVTRSGTGNWTTNPDATSVFLILPVPYVTVQASLDKTGYSLTTAEHTAISGTDVPAALTAQGYTTARAGYLDTLSGLVAAIWASAARSLTTFGTLTTDAAAAVWAATTRTLSAFGFPVTASNLPGDYQQRGVVVTLPALPNVTVGGYAAGQDPATLTWAAGVRTLTAFSFAPNSGNPGLTTAQQTELDAVKAKTDGLPADPASNTQVGTRLATSAYTAPANPTDYAKSNVAPSWWVSPDNADVATALSDLAALVARTDPATALSTIQTAATAIKAKTDQLTFTGSNVNAAVSGGGGTTVVYGDAGAITYTYTVYDVGGVTPLPGAAVHVSADSAGTHPSQTKITDSLGRVTFQLDAGTVYFWRSHPLRTFSDNPQSEVVS